MGVKLYEMLVGQPPYYDEEKEQLFENILKLTLYIPSNIKRTLSPNCLDILQKLFEKEPQKRLGTMGGASEIKKHPFFSGTDWDEVFKRKQQMPEPYLAKVAYDIIQPQPYLVEGHPSTKG